MKNELGFYDGIKNWDFSMIKYIEENLTDWDLYRILNDCTSPNSKILDLGTGGGEKVLRNFPIVKEIIATDFSKEMINTANKNLAKTERKDITFKQMDNLNITTPDNYFDIVVARHTCIDAKGIYKTLKIGGKLLLRGVDKLDCWALKRLFGRGQALNDPKPISLIDYERVMDAGFRSVELIPLHDVEYYKTKEDLYALLQKTPILDSLSEEKNQQYERKTIETDLFSQYVDENETSKGIKLVRRYYGIVAKK